MRKFSLALFCLFAFAVVASAQNQVSDTGQSDKARLAKLESDYQRIMDSIELIAAKIDSRSVKLATPLPAPTRTTTVLADGSTLTTGAANLPISPTSSASWSSVANSSASSGACSSGSCSSSGRIGLIRRRR